MVTFGKQSTSIIITIRSVIISCKEKQQKQIHDTCRRSHRAKRETNNNRDHMTGDTSETDYIIIPANSCCVPASLKSTVKDAGLPANAFCNPLPWAATRLASPWKRLTDVWPGFFSTVSTTIPEVSRISDFFPSPAHARIRVIDSG